MASERIQRQIDRLLDEAERAVSQRDWLAVRAHAEDVLALDPGNDDGRAFLAAADRALDQGTTSPSGKENQPAQVSHQLQSTHPTSFAAGRYQVQRFLGEGGKKRVYLVHDTALDRDVAFALIKTESLDQESGARIAREAQAMGRLGDHPHIVQIHDLGQEDGQPYMVLPLMPGGDVEGLIEKGEEHRIPLEQALEIARCVCRRLEFAHGQGHRAPGPEARQRLAHGGWHGQDRGLRAGASHRPLAAHPGGDDGGDRGLHAPGAGPGAGGDASGGPLFSWGHALRDGHGATPFLGDESVAIITQHLNTPPVAPTWHNSDCPPSLEALVLRLLEKDPARRPASAAEVLAALESVAPAPAGREPVEGQEATPASDQHPMYRRVFVGREGELRQLETAFDGALSGQGSLLMVVGEPGIGKALVAAALLDGAALPLRPLQPGAVVLRGLVHQAHAQRQGPAYVIDTSARTRRVL